MSGIEYLELIRLNDEDYDLVKDSINVGFPTAFHVGPGGVIQLYPVPDKDYKIRVIIDL